MEKDQLISMIHFLVKREDERAQENQELKDMVKELAEMCGVSTLECFKEFFKAASKQEQTKALLSVCRA